jgi:c-di-GMP-binding flagellar brake protein YcgR
VIRTNRDWPKNMTDEILKLKTGDNVQVQLSADQNDTRYMVRVIGYEPNVSLLVSTPRANGLPLLVRDGQAVTVRLLTGNTVYGFESQVLRICRLPFPYLHLSYPRSFESLVVRKAQRASANIIASVENCSRATDSAEPFSARISDLSVAGAMLEASMPMGEVGDAIMIRAKVQVAGMDKYLVLAAIVRALRVREAAEPGGKTLYLHGVEFQMIGPEDQLVLHGFVYEQIATGKAI